MNKKGDVDHFSLIHNYEDHNLHEDSFSLHHTLIKKLIFPANFVLNLFFRKYL